MTEADYLSLPEEEPYLEYVDGLVVQKPMSNADDADLVGEIQYHLVAYRKVHGGRTGPERRVGVGSNYRLPDTGYWPAGRPAGNDALPALAVEVRSPSQTLMNCAKSAAPSAARAWRRAG